MRSILKWTVCSILVLMFVFSSQLTAFAGASRNPLVEPYEITEYTEVSDNIVNILLMGIDLGTNDYWGSGRKKNLEDCHTDAVMVVAINMDQKRIDLISLPRDTVTYVPGVKGVYKLNAAVNCAETFEEGLEKAKDAAEWLLGDIQIDYYFAVDMNTMIALGDAIDGVDGELEMNYYGHSGTRYYKGMQHLDGVGITDYLRARTNATVNYNDIGRTNRQREMMLAIFDKLKNDEDMIWNLLETASTQYDGFFTDITTAVLLQLAMMMPTVLSIDADEIGTHVFDGPYRTSNSWNFTFTDQEIRQAVIAEVYGVSVEPLQYVSYAYQQWLDDDAGYSSVHYISVAQEMIAYADSIGAKNMTDSQKEAYAAFMDAYDTAVSAFEIASDTMSEEDSSAMYASRVSLREAADELNRLFGYAMDLHWSHNTHYWYNDQYINEYQLNWN